MLEPVSSPHAPWNVLGCGFCHIHFIGLFIIHLCTADNELGQKHWKREKKCDVGKMNGGGGRRLWPQARIPLSAREFLHWQEEHENSQEAKAAGGLEERRGLLKGGGTPGGPGLRGRGRLPGVALRFFLNETTTLFRRRSQEMVSYGSLTLLSLKTRWLNPQPCEILSLKSVFPSIWHGNPGWYVRWS